MEKIIIDDFDVNINTSDCTVFRVKPVGATTADIEKDNNIDEIIEEALDAISDVIMWARMIDRAANASRFLRQIGRLDVKYFMFLKDNDHIVSWLNPMFMMAHKSLAMMTAMFQNSSWINPPLTHPVPEATRRVMASVDLVNLGFYTESFITLFSLIDDLTQEIVKSGLSKKGITDKKKQNRVLLAIKEERLKHYLTSIAQLCDWSNMETAEPELYSKLVKANEIRNKIMHGSKRLYRKDALLHLQTLLETYAYLARNPFSHQVPGLPVMKIVFGDFVIIKKGMSAFSQGDEYCI